MFYSPLQRAVQTSEIVWGGRAGPTLRLPCLREVDLYSFQALDKVEGRSRYPSQYKDWQTTPADFVIDGHAPVRELWYRASLAWREILGSDALGSQGLVVAHNAVNQALLCTAVGLPPNFFRRFAQSNAAFSVLDFEPGPGGAPRVRVERVNQVLRGALGSVRVDGQDCLAARCGWCCPLLLRHPHPAGPYGMLLLAGPWSCTAHSLPAPHFPPRAPVPRSPQPGQDGQGGAQPDGAGDRGGTVGAGAGAWAGRGRLGQQWARLPS
jgi:broad specificity phosphatase PhoE